MSRFGDTFANTGAVSILNNLEETKDLNIGTKTLMASFSASLFRILSTPIDTCKTILQVEGKSGLKNLNTKVINSGDMPKGLSVLWHGALGSHQQHL